MKKIIDVLLFVLDWTWCFPQSLVGFIKSRWWKNSLGKCLDGQLDWIKNFEREKRVKIYLVSRQDRDEHWFFKNVSGSGISRYISLIECNPSDGYVDDKETIKHEYGHTLQSRILGPLFPLSVGIASPLFNLKGRKLKKQGWSWKKRVTWYYSRWCERWADILGKVNRQEWINRWE